MGTGSLDRFDNSQSFMRKIENVCMWDLVLSLERYLFIRVCFKPNK